MIKLSDINTTDIYLNPADISALASDNCRVYMLSGAVFYLTRGSFERLLEELLKD